jgi:hypothetical protein
VSALVLTVATPPTSATVCGTPLIVTVTDPVGVHVDGATADTVIVTVTGAQHTDGLGAAVTVVAVDAWVTTGVNEPVELAKQVLPRYVAVTGPEAGVSELVVTVATPATNGTVTGPDGKVTVTDPVGVHAAGATAATVTVNVTGAQHTAGEGDCVIVVDVAAGATTGVTVPVDPVKQASPL